MGGVALAGAPTLLRDFNGDHFELGTTHSAESWFEQPPHQAHSDVARLIAVGPLRIRRLSPRQ